MLDLGGKVAFVTGAGSVGPGWGNGKATAVTFARDEKMLLAVQGGVAGRHRPGMEPHRRHWFWRAAGSHRAPAAAVRPAELVAV